MHIIKISSASFKIILTKEDVEKYGKKYVANDKIDSYGFFCELKDITGLLFDSPFETLSVNAEFFQSKDGGGELFLSATPKQSVHNYCFLAYDSQTLCKMCRRLLGALENSDSKLYFDDNCYKLVVAFDIAPDEIVKGIMSEYGKVDKCSLIYLWHLQEHAKCIFQNNAIKQIAEKLTS